MKIENGAESSQLSADGSFVIIQIPITVVGEAPKGGAGSRFTLGSFRGRETKLRIGTGAQATLYFRIPKEQFRPRERLTLEIVARGEVGAEMVLWAKRYEAALTGSVPHLEPMTDYPGEAPEENG